MENSAPPVFTNHCPQVLASSSGSSLRAQKVEDDRNQREDQQEVDEKTRGVKDDKAANPRRKEHQSQNEKHVSSFPDSCQGESRIESLMKVIRGLNHEEGFTSN
jgi:hypothetical protein